MITVPRCVKQVKTRLRDLIEVKYGLLVVLDGKGVLTTEEYTRLNDEKDTYTMIDGLLDIISNKSDGLCQLFLDSLDETFQSHVANFIRHLGCISNGRR